MTIVFILVLAFLLVAFAIPEPSRRILPAYAFIVPVGSVVDVEIPLPSPFNTVSSLLGACVVATIVVHLVAYRDGRVPSLPVAVWVVFLAWTTATSLYAIATTLAVQTVLVAIPLVGLALMVAILPVGAGSLDAVRLGLILSGITVGLYAISLLASGSELTEAGPGGRLVIGAAGSGADPNILAASLLLPFAVSLERMIFGGDRYLPPAVWRGLGLAGALLCAFAVVVTGSRGGLTSLLIAFLLVLWLARRQPDVRERARRAAFTVLASVGAVVGLAFIVARVAPGSALDEVVDVLPLGRLANTEIGGSGRIEIWTAGVRLCPQYCTAGSGAGTFPTAYNQAFAFSGVQENVGADYAAHNIFLQAVVELGVPGLTLLLLALLAEWRALALADPRRTVAVKAAFVSILVANFFISTLWFKYVWLVIVLIRMVEDPAREPVATPARAASLEPAS